MCYFPELGVGVIEHKGLVFKDINKGSHTPLTFLVPENMKTMESCMTIIKAKELE